MSLKLQVLVSRAENLTNLETAIGKSDPYVVLLFQGEKRKTNVVYGNLNPTWEEKFEWKIEKRASQSDEYLTITVKDYERFGRNRLIGETSLLLRNALEALRPLDYELTLFDHHQRPTTGTLYITVTFQQRQEEKEEKNEGGRLHFEEQQDASLTEPNSLQLTRQKMSIRDGIFPNKKTKYQVRVKVIEARQLLGSNINPVCRISLREQAKQTRAKKKTTKPWWNEIFFFHIDLTPVELFSESIDFRVNNARALRSNLLIGFFKLDLGIIYEQPQHAFLNKWLLLGNPDDAMAGAMGYLKASIVVLGPGDECPNLKTPARSEEEDVESNLLLPAGVQLRPAAFIFDIYQGEDLPRMDMGIMESARKIIGTGDGKKELLDPYLVINFAGHQIKSKIMYCDDNPHWNQKLLLGFQFPSMCENIKLVIKDWDRLTEDDVIASAQIALPSISAPGDTGFLPCFGPSWVNFYGSPREYTDLGTEYDDLNLGKGEGCAYRGRVMLSLRTNIGAYPDVTSFSIEDDDVHRVEPFCRRRKYSLHAAFIDATMISVIDTPVEFEVSIGNFGNKFEYTLTPSPSTTQPTNAVFDGCRYYFLPWKETKPCVVISSQWEDVSFRLEAMNMLTNIVDSLETSLNNVRKGLDAGKPITELAVEFVAMLNQLIFDADITLPKPMLGQHVENELDRTLRDLRTDELYKLRQQAAELREKATDLEEALQEVENYIKILKHLATEPQSSVPDVIIWMLSGKKRVAYCRIPPNQIIFNPDPRKCGKWCGKLQTLMLKFPETGERHKMKAMISQLQNVQLTDPLRIAQHPDSVLKNSLWKIPGLLRMKLWLGLEMYDVHWRSSQTDAELSVFAETYENQAFVLGKWTSSGPTMTRYSWSDASGMLNLPKENFVAPLGWRFEGDWFVHPEPSMQYDEDAGHRSFLEDVYENQNRLPGSHWVLAPTPWTDIRGDPKTSRDDIELPPNWEWDDVWQVDLNRAVDEEGWEYTVEATLGGYHPVEKTFHLCRRRRWVRQRNYTKDSVQSALESSTDIDKISQISSQSDKSSSSGWEYAPLFNMKFHTKSKRMDLVRRRRWHRKLVAEDPTAPLVFNLTGTAKPKASTVWKKLMPEATGTSQQKTAEEARIALLSCPRLFLVFKSAYRFQLRTYVYQARDLAALDKSGFSDPYACISFMNQSQKTEVVTQSLCPIWDQTLLFEEVIFYGDVVNVQREPPPVVVEVYDRDAFGEDEFLGRSLITTAVHLKPSSAMPSRLAWYDVMQGKQCAGEILLSSELFLADSGDLPFLPPRQGDLYVIPSGIRPVLQRTAIEVLCWGIRNMKTFEFSQIIMPSIQFECGGKMIESKTIKDARVNPNFEEPILYLEMMLPQEELYLPPLHIKVRDHRRFGRKPIVGTHVIRSLHSFLYDAVYYNDDDEIKGDGGPPETAVDIPEDDRGIGQDNHAEEDETLDWWAKYYASVGELSKAGNYLEKGYDTIEVFPVELEKIDPFKGFKDFLNIFPLKRGKSKDLEESEIVGEFKGTIRVYPLPQDPKATHPKRMLTGIPKSTVEEITVRVYIIKALDITPMDPNGLADPYVSVTLGRRSEDSHQNYKPNTVNPVFGEVFELYGTLPMDKDLTVSVLDYDLISGDDLIGQTVIDLENRYLTKYRGTCGLPKTYQISGPCKWRDCKTPRQILWDTCEVHNLPRPRFTDTETMYIGDTMYKISDFERDIPTNIHLGPPDQRLALHVLHLMELVPEHVETRSLYNALTPGLEQGKIEMWVDIFSKSHGKPGSSINISPRVPTKFVLRIVIWNTYDVLLTETNIMGEQMSDIYVKGWISGLDDAQKTDVHYRSMDGEGNFNWRLVFPLEYLVTEGHLVVKKKEHFWSLDITEHLLPPILCLQIWDNDTFSSDDLIGTLEMDLNCMPLPAKNAAKCGLHQLGMDKKQKKLLSFRKKKTTKNTKYINLFEKKRVYGFWPSFCNDPEQGRILAGKIEMELEILTEEDAEKAPAGLGRDEPNANPTLEVPNRPATSFMWFTSPWKSFKHVIWRNYKMYILTIIIILLSVLLMALFIYSFPGAIANRLVTL